MGAHAAPTPGPVAKVAQAVLDQAPEGPDLVHPNLGRGGQGGLRQGGR